MDIRDEYNVSDAIVDDVLATSPTSVLAVVELDIRREELEALDQPVFDGEPQWRVIGEQAATLRGRADLTREVADLMDQFSQ